MKKSEKGAAMVLALLVLMFFMAISLNIFFIAEKRAKKSGNRVVGSKAQSVVDTGSNLGVYEVRNAFRYFRGYTNSTVTSITVTQGGIDFNAPNEKLRPMRSGASYIRTSTFHEYFTCYEASPTGYDASGVSPPVMVVADTAVTNSAIATTPSGMAKIWLRAQTVNNTRSVGGYEIDKTAPVETGKTSYTAITRQFYNLSSGQEEYTYTGAYAEPISVTYIKHLRTPEVLRADGKVNIESMDFWIKYREEASLTQSGIRAVIRSEDAKEIIVRNSRN